MEEPVTTTGAGRAGARLNPDSVPMLWAAVITATIIAVASFLWSWDAIIEVSSWAGLAPGRAWVAPVVVDGAILVYTIAALVQRARGESARLAWFALTLFTVVSVALNAAHGWTTSTGSQPWQRTAGTILAALAPVAVFLSTHTLARLLVAGHTPTAARHDAASGVETGADTLPHAANASGSSPSGEVPAHSASVSSPVVRLHAIDSTADGEPGVQGTPGPSSTKERVLELHRDGLSQRDIASEVGISKTSVARILREHTTAA